MGLAGILVCTGNSSSLEHRPLQPSGTNSSLYFTHIDVINLENIIMAYQSSWKGSNCHRRKVARLKKCILPFTEVSPILHMCHMLGTEMIHFVHQMQYYITFEVRMEWSGHWWFSGNLRLVSNRLRNSEQCSEWEIVVAHTPFGATSVIKWKQLLEVKERSWSSKWSTISSDRGDSMETATSIKGVIVFA